MAISVGRGLATRVTRRLRRGQAMFELAMGMFAIALVVSALCGFAIYIARSLEMQNSLRVKSHSQHDTLEVSEFSSEYIFGRTSVSIDAEVRMPRTEIVR